MMAFKLHGRHALRGTIVILVFLAVTSCDEIGSNSTLDIKETLGLAYRGHRWRDAWPIQRNDLALGAKPILLDEIHKVPLRYHCSIVGVIGLLDESEGTVRFIDEHIANTAEKLRSNGDLDAAEIVNFDFFVEEAVAAIARMAHNGVPGANQLFETMTYPDYWERNKISNKSSLSAIPRGMLVAISLSAVLAGEKSADYVDLVASRLEEASYEIPSSSITKIEMKMKRHENLLSEDPSRASRSVHDLGFQAMLREQRELAVERYNLDTA